MASEREQNVKTAAESQSEQQSEGVRVGHGFKSDGRKPEKESAYAPDDMREDSEKVIPNT